MKAAFKVTAAVAAVAAVGGVGGVGGVATRRHRHGQGASARG